MAEAIRGLTEGAGSGGANDRLEAPRDHERRHARSDGPDSLSGFVLVLPCDAATSQPLFEQVDHTLNGRGYSKPRDYDCVCNFVRTGAELKAVVRVIATEPGLHAIARLTWPSYHPY